MAELSIDLTKLPDDIKEKLAELELELSEGKSQFSYKLLLILAKLIDNSCKRILNIVLSVISGCIGVLFLWKSPCNLINF